MVIKKVSNDEIVIESLKSKTSVKQYNGDLTISIDSEDVNINKPGEYEFGDIQLVALEITPDQYNSKVNFARISVEGIDIAVVMTEIVADKDHLRDIADVQMLIVSNDVSLDSIKKLLTYFEPQALIFLNVSDSAQLQKDLSLPNLTTDKVLKFKNTDFKSDNEAVVINSFVLEK